MWQQGPNGVVQAQPSHPNTARVSTPAMQNGSTLGNVKISSFSNVPIHPMNGRTTPTVTRVTVAANPNSRPESFTPQYPGNQIYTNVPQSLMATRPHGSQIENPILLDSSLMTVRSDGRHQGKADDALERVGLMQGYMSDVSVSILALQEEVSRLKLRMLSTTKHNLFKYFMVSDRYLVQGVFSEWKDLFRINKHNNDVKASNYMRLHEANMYEAQMNDANQRLSDANVSFAKEQEKTHSHYDQKFSDVKKRHDIELQKAREETMQSRKDLSEARQNEKDISMLFDQAQTMLMSVQETVKDFPSSLAKDRNSKLLAQYAASGLSADPNEIVKEQLHDILRTIDPRYLGRSKYPTVNEISRQERMAYASSSVCAVGDQCIMHQNHGNGSPCIPRSSLQQSVQGRPSSFTSTPSLTYVQNPNGQTVLKQ